MTDEREKSSGKVKADIISKLLEGHARFQREVFPEYRAHFHLLREMQKPDVLFITCSDSRVVPNLIFQTEPGDLFLCRVVGNVVPPYGEVFGGTSSTIEYAVQVLHVRHIIVCGHSDCGAVRAVFEDKDLRKLPVTDHWLRFIEECRPEVRPVPGDADELARLKEFICANVRRQVQNLSTHPEVQAAMAAGKLQVHGWFYNIQTGEVEIVDLATGEHRPLAKAADHMRRSNS